jgi:aspartyl/asparaginyl-tRNA synthetase
MKDREENPQRQMTLIFMQRDYLNLTNWYVESSGGNLTSKQVDYLRMICRIHKENFTDREHQYNNYSTTFYQSALKYLGTAGISVTEEGELPFEARMGLTVGLTGVTQDPAFVSRWFSSTKEFHDYMEERAKDATGAIDEIYREITDAYR